MGALFGGQEQKPSRAARAYEQEALQSAKEAQERARAREASFQAALADPAFGAESPELFEQRFREESGNILNIFANLGFGPRETGPAAAAISRRRGQAEAERAQRLSERQTALRQAYVTGQPFRIPFGATQSIFTPSTGLVEGALGAGGTIVGSEILSRQQRATAEAQGEEYRKLIRELYGTPRSGKYQLFSLPTGDVFGGASYT